MIVDYVINHSATSHPLFQAAAADRDSPYRRWYLWQDPAPTGWKIFDKDPWNRTPTGYYFSQFSAGMLMMRNSRKKAPSTLFDSAKAAEAVSDSREASHSPSRPTE